MGNTRGVVSSLAVALATRAGGDRAGVRGEYQPSDGGAVGGLAGDGEDACAQCAGKVQPAREVGTADGAGEVGFFGVGSIINRICRRMHGG